MEFREYTEYPNIEGNNYDIESALNSSSNSNPNFYDEDVPEEDEIDFSEWEFPEYTVGEIIEEDELGSGYEIPEDTGEDVLEEEEPITSSRLR